MERPLVVAVSGGLVSPLGRGVAANYAAVRSGQSRLQRHVGGFALPEPFVAALFDRAALTAELSAEMPDAAAYTFFEQITIMAIRDALKGAPEVDMTSPDVLLLISTTKGNVSRLQGATDDPDVLPGTSARRIAACFGNPNRPVVVSNACISGVAAQVTALRLLEEGRYRHVVVAGADEQSRFIVSGFQSFKALSPAACRPFDADRDGLNLGEAAAAVVLSARPAAEVGAGEWVLRCGAIRNDANHISGPSRVGEGSFRALQAVMAGRPSADLAFVNAHGTATPYNDEMEAIALDRAGLIGVPVNSLKGVLGHTMGAAGIVETLLSMAAVTRGEVLPTHGFSRLGVSRNVAVSSRLQTTDRSSFVKLMSGFGGCNGALLCVRSAGRETAATAAPAPAIKVAKEVWLTSDGTVTIDGRPMPCDERGAALLTALYRREVGDYPKFFKMDVLSRLGLVATELLLKSEADRYVPRDDRAVVVCGRYGSYVADCRHAAAIAVPGGLASPAVFVYTLANIVSGEIAIRNRYFGETSSFLFDAYDADLVRTVAATAFADAATRSVICAWLDCPSADRFEARVQLLTCDASGAA